MRQYGALRFAATNGAPTIFTCLRSGAPAHHLAAITFELWRLKRPTLLITLAGEGAELGPRRERALVAGLKEVAATTGAWLLSAGTQRSAGALVDRVLESWQDERNPPICIGVLPWPDAEPRGTPSKQFPKGRPLKDNPDGLCLKVYIRSFPA